jgi:hypothetical protein
MVGMPDWFAKTKEMVAADLYFSLADAGSESALVARYEQALGRLAASPIAYPKNPAALSGYAWSAASVDQHFVGDWIHYRYYQNPAVFGDHGGDFWPSIKSSVVIDRLRAGVRIAIHKALGASHLASIGGLSQHYLDDLWGTELAYGVEIHGVRPLAMSWSCVAPTESDYFEVAALRGPSVVEFTIATPKPYGHSAIMGVVTRLIDGFYDDDDDDDDERPES